MKEEEFAEKASEIRAKAIERGRSRVIEKACSCLASGLAKYKYNPYDIKALFHPVDFVIFDGLNTGGALKDITFLTRTRRGDLLQKSVQEAVKDGSYSWKVARVTDDGGVEIQQ